MAPRRTHRGLGAEGAWGGGHRAAALSLCPLFAECSYFSPPTTVILLILLCFEGLLFLIFTSVMFGTQVHSICTDETVSRRAACTDPGAGHIPHLQGH